MQPRLDAVGIITVIDASNTNVVAGRYNRCIRSVDVGQHISPNSHSQSQTLLQVSQAHEVGVVLYSLTRCHSPVRCRYKHQPSPDDCV